MAVEIGEEHDAGLVRVSRRLKDVARERDGRRQYRLEGRAVTGVQGLQGAGRGRRDRVDDAEESVAVALFVAEDQADVVEIVARVHPDPGGQTSPHLDLPL